MGSRLLQILKLPITKNKMIWIFDDMEGQSKINILIFILIFTSQRNLVLMLSFPRSRRLPSLQKILPVENSSLPLKNPPFSPG